MKNHRPPSFSVIRRAKYLDGTQNPKVIVLHDTESDGRGAKFLNGIFDYLDSKRLSVHACVAADGSRGIAAPANYKCRHAPPNSGKIGIEQAGLASYPKSRWLTRQRQLHSTSLLMAWYSYRWDIPLKFSTVSGVCQHKDLPEGGHHDCGRGYPFAYVLGLANAYRKTVYMGKYK